MARPDRCCCTSLGRIIVLLWLSFTHQAFCETCSDSASCQAKLSELSSGLQMTSTNFSKKLDDLTLLSSFRSSILNAQRPPLPGAQRDELSNISPLLLETTSDDRYQAKYPGFSKDFARTVAPNTTVDLFTFLALKPPDDTRAQAIMPSFLVVIVDAKSHLSMHSQFGEVMLTDFELGHDPTSKITYLDVAEIEGARFVVTANSRGECRVHDIKILATLNVTEVPVAMKFKVQPTVDVTLKVNLEFSCSFALLRPDLAQLSGIVPVAKKEIVYFLASDSQGNITIYKRNGTFLSTRHITDQPGGIKRLLHGMAQTVFFITSSTYGFFSAQKLALDGPECPVAGGPLVDVAVDPTGAYSRPALSLASGDIVIYVARKGSTKACCELLQKLPRVSQLPLQTFTLRDQLLALQMPATQPLQDSAKESSLRELYLLSLRAVDRGYFAAPSDLITLRAGFWPKQPVAFAVQLPNKKGKEFSAHIAFRFGRGIQGVDLYDFTMQLV